MRDGFFKVCAATPQIQVADTEFNGKKIMEIINQCVKAKVKLLVFPELCITGYTCGELFLQNTLLQGAKEQLFCLADATVGTDILVIVGLPYMRNGKLYNVAAVLQNGRVLGMIPKKNLPNYSEFYEARHFVSGNDEVEYEIVEDQKNNRIMNDGEEIPFGSRVLFQCEECRDLILGVEVCEDLWVPIPPSSYHAMAGATVIANLSASDEITGKAQYRRELLKNQSARLLCAYIYADAGNGESTMDVVYSAHNMIAENGILLAEAKRFKNEMIVSEIDIQKLISERRRMTTFQTIKSVESEYELIPFSYAMGRTWSQEEEAYEGEREIPITPLTRTFSRTPFVPGKKEERAYRCEEILTIQAMGLKKRLEHTHCQYAVVGISGGLDSTLALLVITKAFDLANLPRKQIIGVTMPCFGTTDRTYENAVTLVKEIGATLREIPINEAVTVHLRDLGHDLTVHDVTYENAQARERTQILMNLANQYGGMVIGTGDLSELVLGWATYNGDHMSMYGVNCSIPKTLVRYLVEYYAEMVESQQLQKVLKDVLDTPVSPELLPPKEGKIAQKTEDLVGPYELHDFFLYYVIRFGFTPGKIYRMAVSAFGETYSNETILRWLKTFYQRFFSQQFKRSCLPDGPKVGSVAVSPRGDLRMPSDACVALWKKEIEELSMEL